MRLLLATALLVTMPEAKAKAKAAEVPASRQAQVVARSFLPEQPLSRARRLTPLAAVIQNAGDTAVEVQPRLMLPTGVRLLRADAGATVRIEDADERKVTWDIEADEAVSCELRLEVDGDGVVLATASLAIQFLPPLPLQKPPYIPEPAPARKPQGPLIGAHHCPLWEADKPHMWDNILKHPERTPALGFYAQANPEVADWETKWAVEHGIDFFIYNKWLVNRVFGGGEATGYRLGLLQGKPCFEVPWTPWSHHLSASEALPLDKWVHLAGTFDSQTMKIYVDGQVRGSMPRSDQTEPVSPLPGQLRSETRFALSGLAG